MRKIFMLMAILLSLSIWAAEKTSCLYAEKSMVVLSDGSSWYLLGANDYLFEKGEEVVIQKKIGETTYLVGKSGTVPAYYDETFEVETKRTKHCFPVDVVSEFEEGGRVQLVHTYEGDLLVFALESLTPIMLPPDQPFTAFSNKGENNWYLIHPVTGQLLDAIYIATLSNPVQRTVRILTEESICFSDGEEIPCRNNEYKIAGFTCVFPKELEDYLGIGEYENGMTMTTYDVAIDKLVLEALPNIGAIPLHVFEKN